VFWYRITHAIREEPEEKILDALLEGEEVENPGMLNPNRCARPGGTTQISPVRKDREKSDAQRRTLTSRESRRRPDAVRARLSRRGTCINRRVGLRFSTLAPQRRRCGTN
jgi:hypothetical protein